MLGQLWAAQWVELLCSADTFWRSLLLAALCHPAGTTPPGLQEIQDPLSLGAAPAYSCAAVWDRNREQRELFPFLLCTWNSTHLHTLPPKGMKGFRPRLNNSHPNTGGKQEAVFHPKNIIFFQMGTCSIIMQALGGQWIFI